MSIDEKQTIDFSLYKGKKVVVLNVASKCGYTDQYADWEKFYRLNKEKVVVLGFPSNEFLWQERGSNNEIAAFCTLTYGVTFPMFQKTTVRGSDKSPLYQWLTKPDLNGWNKQEPLWNFCKYLIDENGNLRAFFSSKIKPDDEAFLMQFKM
jgi:glutathione peroxidase